MTPAADPPLPPAARAAVRHVRDRSTGAPLDRSLPVTLAFHPDRDAGRVAPGRPVLEGLRRTGVYLSQFATGTGNGGLTAHPGGDRWRWESRIFGSAYDAEPTADRPVYGALDHSRRPVGGSPRFGSAHLRLRPGVLPRTTFCYPDSWREPTRFGTVDRFALLAELDRDAAGRDPLDGYVEAQVHGPVRLDRDVEALVLDPSHRDTRVHEQAARLPCPVEWHGGFRLDADGLLAAVGYRGAEPVRLGLELARDGVLTPRELGAAAAGADPQLLKWLWHCLARFGAPDLAP